MSGKQARSLKIVTALTPDNYAAGTNNGAAIDTEGFDAVDIGVDFGTPGASATADVKVQHAPDNGAGAPGTFVDLDNHADVATGAHALPQQTTAAGMKHIRINGQPFERWIRIVAVTAVQVYDLGAQAVLHAAQVEPTGSPDLSLGYL